MTATKRTAIVVGATGGIGHAIAIRLAKDGFAIAAAYAGNAARAEELVVAIKSIGGSALAVKADVSSASDVEHLFRSALDTFEKSTWLCIPPGSCPWARSSTAIWKPLIK